MGRRTVLSKKKSLLRMQGLVVGFLAGSLLNTWLEFPENSKMIVRLSATLDVKLSDRTKP